MGVNVVAVLVATVVSFMFGAVWYGTLSKHYIAANAKSEAELKAGARPMPLLFAFSLIAGAISAYMLDGLMLHLATAGVAPTPRNGAIDGFFVWLGFVAPMLVTNYAYQGRTWALAAIDCGHWLGVLVLQGLVLGWFGLR